MYFVRDVVCKLGKVCRSRNEVLAGGVTFTDSNPALGLVSGDVVVTRASNEQGIAGASEFGLDFL